MSIRIKTEKQIEGIKKASEIKEVHNKFENIVWSEDKFPKK
mgnify:CR=1 FL=1